MFARGLVRSSQKEPPTENYVTREIAAKTVFVMLYIGAVEGEDRWLRPDQVTRMTDAQADLADADARELWLSASMRLAGGDIAGRWYAANTREPIRDETLREGLVRLGAVKEREGLATTSPLPRYALATEFAGLFDPGLKGEALSAAIEQWRSANLSSGALARVAIMRRGAAAQGEKVLVTFPGGEARHMEPGPSSVISKSVVEEFAPRFLEEPAVIWLSESRNQVVARDGRSRQGNRPDHRTRSKSARPDTGRSRPNRSAAGLRGGGRQCRASKRIAASGVDGRSRRRPGFDEAQVAFVTAYADRDDAAFKGSVSELAWRSFAWFMSEPDPHRCAAIKVGPLVRCGCRT